MSIGNYAVVENAIVSNVIVWDGVSEWEPPEGSLINLLPVGSPVGPGYEFDGKNYAAPSNPA
jgi:hypothetical protein